MTKWVNGLNIHLKSLIYGIAFIILLAIAVAIIIGIIYSIINLPYNLGIAIYVIFCAYWLGYFYLKGK